MSGSLPPGQQAYNGQHMVPGSVPMNYSLNGPQMSSSMGSPMGNSMGLGNAMNGMGNGMGMSNGLGNGGGLGSPMSLNGMAGLSGLGSLNGGNLNGGLGGGGQYQQHQQHQQHQQARPLPSPQFYNQGLPHQTQFSSPNLLHSPLGQLPQQHQQPQHQQHHQPQHQQRFQPSPQQNHMQFPVPVQRTPSMTSSNGGNSFSFQHNGMSVSPNLSAPISIPVPATVPSPTTNHLASPLQFLPQQLPQQHQHQQHQTQHQQQQQHQSPRYTQQQSVPPMQMQMPMFTGASPGQQSQHLPKQRQPSQSHSQSQPLQQQHSQHAQPNSQPLSQSLSQPAITQFSPLPQHITPSQLLQHQPSLHSPQMHQHQQVQQVHQPSPQMHQVHQVPHAHNQLQQQLQPPMHSPSPQQQHTPKPAKPPKAPKPQKSQQAKKPISLPDPSTQPVLPPSQTEAVPPPPMSSTTQKPQPQQRKQSSITPSPMPSPLPTNSPRVSPKGGVQKPKSSASVGGAASKAVGAAVAGVAGSGTGSGSGAAAKAQRKPSVSGMGSSMAKAKPTPKRTPGEAAALLVCIADECLAKAQAAAPALAQSRNEDRLKEYYKLLATGLGCLDTAVRTFKFPPRIEVKIKIRYASILSTETENLMEAETALQSAIATCEKHRLPDLKIYVQFLFMKVLFRRKPKAALISIQTHIADCSDRRQTYWTYAFRFLKALFYLQSGNPVETNALENLHGITVLAEQRGDHAVYVLASLLQALSLFRTTEPDVVERIQTCMAAASKYQLDESVHIPQLDVLWLLLDLACSLYQKEKALTDKLNNLQNRLEELKESPQWTSDACDLLLPLRKDTPNVHTISADTSDVLQPGESNDFLVLTSFSKVKAFVLGFAYSGLTLSPKQQTSDRKSMDYWTEALKMLSQSSASKPPAPIFLHEAIDESRWRANTSSYVLVLMGLNAATHCDWAKVQDCIKQLETPAAEANDGPLDVLALYLKGVLKQGQGELNDALHLFEDQRLALPAVSDGSPSSSSAMASAGPAAAAAAAANAASANEGHLRQEVMLLAAMNRLMIMQLNRLRDEPKINMLVEQLKQTCVNHPNPEIKTAYSLVMAAITTEPPLSMHDIKSHIQQGLNGSTVSGNAQCLNIALNTMRYRLFENVVGEQALKSAKAGSTQAKKSGNILWMSVADGMLADTYEVQGQTAQAQVSRQAGVQYANESWERTQI